MKSAVARIASLPVVLLGLVGCSNIERSLLFFPSHRTGSPGLTPWMTNGTLIGFSRTVASPKAVWLMLHGNAGQAADRAYALPHFPADDSVFILEYPGYGSREGTPSSASFNAAAMEAKAARAEVRVAAVAGRASAFGSAASPTTRRSQTTCA